jgi:uncharacterized integral membrane protein (TIGR00698 family)
MIRSPYLPGLALGALVTALSFVPRSLGLPGIGSLSPLMLAVLLGMGVRNTLGRPEAARAGLALSLRQPLRLGIVLLGLQVTLAELMGVGLAGLLLLVAAVALTVLVTWQIGRWLGVPEGLALLIATGTGICGASAIVAANTVVKDSDESVAYALATVTLFGTIAMFVYPTIGAALALASPTYGLWVGASVHEVAQVVAAGFARGDASGELATVSKLARVLLLAPVVIGLGLYLRARAQHAAVSSTDIPAAQAQIPIPWFVFGFLGMVILASTGWLAPEWRSASAVLAQVLLAFALSAVGLETDFRKLVAQGWQPLALGALSTLFIGVGTLVAVISLSS